MCSVSSEARVRISDRCLRKLKQKIHKLLKFSMLSILKIAAGSR